MSEALYKLHAWLSPGYPVGAYVYSHGLEWAVNAGDVHDAATTQSWVRDCVLAGAGRTDAILLAHAWRAERETDRGALNALTDLACALAPSRERLQETADQGAAFGDVTSAAWCEGVWDHVPYPIAVGRAAAAHRLGLADTLSVFVQAFAANVVSAAVRLVPLGQTEGQRVIAALVQDILRTARDAEHASLDDVGGMAFGADIASMRHETQEVRLFRT